MNNIEKIVDILESGQQPSRSECSFFVNKVFNGGVGKQVFSMSRGLGDVYKSQISKISFSKSLSLSCVK